MKVNKFEIASELTISQDGIVTGWFETPALPNVRYTIELDVEALARAQFDAAEEVEEIELAPVAENPGGAVEQVQLPDDTVAPVVATPSTAPAVPAPDSVASDDQTEQQ